MSGTSKRNRRAFLQTSTHALAAGLIPIADTLRHGVIANDAAPEFGPPQVAPTIPANEDKKPLRLGLIIGIGRDPDAAMAKVHDLGLPTCQVFVEEIETDLEGRLRQALNKYQIEATSLVVGGPGKEVWDFYEGPLTIGLVPRETRDARIAQIKKASDFAKQCGIEAVQTHCGFIPENPNDPVYKETITAMREVAGYCRRNSQNFRYETGQETPITLVRAIQDVGLCVPGNISVIGFDDIVSAAFLKPSLTTVHQPLHDMGVEGAQLLLEKIAHPGKEFPAEIVMQPTLTVRESTGPAAAIAKKPRRKFRPEQPA